MISLIKNTQCKILFFTIIFFLSALTISAQSTNQTKNSDSQQNLIGSIIDDLETTSWSRLQNYNALRDAVKSNTKLSDKYKTALISLVDSRDSKNQKDGENLFTHIDRAIAEIGDSTDVLHKYLLCKIAEQEIRLDLNRSIEILESLENIEQGNYPDWLVGQYIFSKARVSLEKGDVDNYMIQANESINHLEKDNQNAKLALIYHNIGNELYFLGVDTAVVFLEKAIALEEELPRLRMRTLTTFAGHDRYREDYKSCLEKQYEVIKIAEEIKDTLFVIEGHFRLSVTMSAQGGKHLEEAKKTIHKAQELAQEVGDELRYARSYGYLGGLYLETKEYQKAIKNSKKSIELLGDRLDDKRMVTYLEIAAAYSELKNIDSTYWAVSQFNAINRGRNPGYTQWGEIILTDYYIREGDYKKAEKTANIAIEMAGDYDKPMKSSALLQLSKIAKAKGNFEKAYEYFIAYSEVESELANDDLSTNVSEARIEAEYEAEKKILLATNEKEKAILDGKRRQSILLGILAGMIALFLAGLYFFSKRKNTKIQEQNSELEKLNNVKDQLFQIIGHDLRKPVISFRNVSKNLNYLIDRGDEKRLKQLGEEIEEEGKSLYNLTDNLLHWALMQKDVLTIKPSKIDLYDVVDENINLFKKVAKEKNITITNNLSSETYAQVDLNSLQTIVRNVLDNAIKFTPIGGIIDFNAKLTGNSVNLSVSDSGVGMTSDLKNIILMGDDIVSQKGTNEEKGSGLGMKIIKSMVEKNNGTLDIISEKDKGSVISISLKKAV